MLKSLTSLRFVFAVMVFLSHATFVSDESSVFYTQKQWFKQGFVGVNFFFILSGFILSYTYFDKFKTPNSGLLKRFYLKRFLKIYPSYWFTLLVSFYFSGELWANANHNPIITSNFFLVQAWFPDKGHQWFLNPPSWSLSVEVFFYLLFPFLVKGINNIKIRYFNVLVGFAFLLQCLVFWFLDNGNVNRYWFYLFPVSNLILFLTGISLYRVYTGYYEILKQKMNTLAEVGTMVLFALAVIYSGYVPESFRLICYYLPFAALLVFVFSFQSGKISSLLSHPFPEYLGKISFQFYLWHFLAIWFWCKMDYDYFRGLNQNLIVGLSFISTMVISVFTYHVLEQPILKRMK